MELGGEYLDLSLLPDRRLIELFQQHRHNAEFLEVLNQELKNRTSDDALDLQIEVVTLRRAARTGVPASVSAKPSASGPVRDWLHA